MCLHLSEFRKQLSNKQRHGEFTNTSLDTNSNSSKEAAAAAAADTAALRIECGDSYTTTYAKPHTQTDIKWRATTGANTKTQPKRETQVVTATDTTRVKRGE